MRAHDYQEAQSRARRGSSLRASSHAVLECYEYHWHCRRLRWLGGRCSTCSVPAVHPSAGPDGDGGALLLSGSRTGKLRNSSIAKPLPVLKKAATALPHDMQAAMHALHRRWRECHHHHGHSRSYIDSRSHIDSRSCRFFCGNLTTCCHLPGCLLPSLESGFPSSTFPSSTVRSLRGGGGGGGGNGGDKGGGEGGGRGKGEGSGGEGGGEGDGEGGGEGWVAHLHCHPRVGSYSPHGHGTRP